MALSFPSNPTTNQQYTYSGTTYTYDGKRWVATTNTVTQASTTVASANVAPANPATGQMWLNSDTGIISVYALGGWVAVGGINSFTPNSVSSSMIVDGSISTTKIVDSAVSTSKILDSAVTAAKLASNSVTTIKIADGAITSAKIADNSITTIDIQDGAVTAAKLAAGAAVPSQTGNSGKYLTTDGTTASWSTVSALPSQATNSGKYLTTDGTTASWATVSTTPADGSITTAKLAAGAVTAAKMTASTDYMPMAIGTTAQRPGTPSNGYMRLNTDTNYLEAYYSSSWVKIAPLGLGSSAATPASSVAQLRSNGITSDGVYWFSTSLVTTPFQAYVRFNFIDGGDWYLLLKLYNQGEMTSGSAYWKNSTTVNDSEFNLASGAWSKYQTWNAFGFTRVMMEMWQGGAQKIPPIMIWNTAKTSMYTVMSAITPANGSGVPCDSTDPAISGTTPAYYSMTMKSGTTFTNNGGLEMYMQQYGLGQFGNNSQNGTPAEGYVSAGFSGAWIGCSLDDVTHTFNAAVNTGSDSGFGIGAGGGNVAKTTGSGYCTWNTSTSTNCFPAYVWIR